MRTPIVAGNWKMNLEPRAARRLADALREELERWLENLRKTCRESRIDYTLLATDEKLHVALTSYLASRARRAVRLRQWQDSGRRTSHCPRVKR